ncbi:3-isopropylmalate dehydrogenase [Allostella sp. ATCC 35155]|nr:3-isopropylmalate dehydrogenase [Stella sp. ATCC 35155]
MAAAKILVVSGDGIGPEIMAEALKVADWFAAHRGVKLEREEALVGGVAIEAIGRPIAEETIARARQADAVLFACAGGPEWDFLEPGKRAGDGLLRLRKELNLFANLRPVKVFDALVGASALKPEAARGVDLVIIRELVGGIYFGEPRGIEAIGNEDQRGFNTETYSSPEVRRVGEVAFRLARTRGGHVHSVDKANVLEASQVWRNAMTAYHAAEHADVTLHHMLVDNCALQIVRRPSQFDVMVMGNMFGDILSDCAAALTGSIGMLPSASIGAPRADGRYHGLYEPIHGTAPDIAGQGIANPAAMILSLALLFDYSLGLSEEAGMITAAIERVLADGLRTTDLAGPGETPVSTSAFGDAVVAALGRA